MLYKIPPKEPFEKAPCAYWDNFLTPDDINLLLAQPEWCKLSEAQVGDSVLHVNSEVRRSNIAWLYPKPEIQIVVEKFANAASEVNNRYFGFDLDGVYEPFQLGVYDAAVEGHYNWHIDSIKTIAPRKLSMVVLLSDPSEFSGGELQVKTDSDQAVDLEMIKGRAWFFPSYTLHRVTPVTRGIRRSLVSWISGKPFR
jgi:PKHD-type hydroxylase